MRNPVLHMPQINSDNIGRLPHLKINYIQMPVDLSETEKKAVGRYLDWHTGILLETDGKMGIYRKESGKLIYKEKADSEDGYLGMYLFLMGKYPLYTGEAGWICMECEKLYGLYERKIKTGFILCA